MAPKALNCDVKWTGGANDDGTARDGRGLLLFVMTDALCGSSLLNRADAAFVGAGLLFVVVVVSERPSYESLPPVLTNQRQVSTTAILQVLCRACLNPSRSEAQPDTWRKHK